MAKARLDDTAVSTSTVCQPQSEKQEHIRRSCISPARCNCISTAIKIKSESTSGRHSHFDLGGVSTASSETNELLAQLYITSTVYQYINSHQNQKRKHFWTTQSFQPGRFLNHELQITRTSSTSVHHQCGIAIILQQSRPQANTLLCNRVVPTWAVYQPQKTRIKTIYNLKRRHLWWTQPCRPGRCINHDQQSKIISAAAVYH